MWSTNANHLAKAIMGDYATFSQGIMGLKLPKVHWHSQRADRPEGMASCLRAALHPWSCGKRWRNNIIITESQFYDPLADARSAAQSTHIS